MQEEQSAAFRFVFLADRRSSNGEPAHRAEESAVGLVPPANESRAAPPVAAERIEATVIAHAIAGVALDLVAPEVAQTRPGIEIARPAGHHRRHGIAALAGRERQRIHERERGSGLGGGQNGVWRTRGREVHCLVAHDHRVRSAATNVAHVFGQDVESAKNLSLAISAGAVILAIFVAIFVRKAVAKAAVILLLGGLIAITMSQRSNISKCASRIENEYRSGSGDAANCRFFGQEFTVSVPNTTPDDVSGLTDVVDAATPTTEPG